MPKSQRALPREPLLRAAARDFLDPDAGPLAPPLRGELLGREGFRQHGAALAHLQPIERRHGRRRPRMPPFHPRLAANLQLLRRARDYIEAVGSAGDALTPAAEALLDHFPLLQAQEAEVRSGLPARWYADLPKLRGEPLAGLPRAYGIAWAFVTHGDATFDPRLLADFLHAYQTVDTLTLGELWALPTLLRVVLMENLARLAETVAAHKAAREAANAVCDHAEQISADTLQALFEATRIRGVHESFLAQLGQRLQSPEPGAALRWQPWLQAQAPEAADSLARMQAIQAANNVSVGHCLRALQAVATFDWPALVQELSPVLQRLDESEAFRAESELTRDQCTHAVERLARAARRPETEVAELARAMAEADEAHRAQGPAYALIGPGQPALAQALGLQRGVRVLSRRDRWAAYAGTLLVGTLLLVDAAMAGEALVPWAELLTVLLLVVPASECVMALVQRLLAESVPVQRLPRLALAEGLQPAQRTLVVMPCLLDSSQMAEQLACALEQAALANREGPVQYALLGDWPDAPQRQMPGDALVLESARRAVAQLNERHPAEGAPRFLLLQRERTWSESEQAWIGWERKRGKLEQLIAHLAGAAPSPFVALGEQSLIAPDTAYLLTLDSDTLLPPGTLRELVAVAAHPLNRPRLDSTGRRVVGGYAMLQPHIATPMPHDGELTPFAWLTEGGAWGLDAYGNGCSQLYQDVFDEGSFAGKGLLDVKACHAALQGRVPEGRLLSHDLYEGLWTRCAQLGDVALFEPPPQHPEAEAARVHRWTRGDWQLLPFLPAALQGRVGVVNLWKLVDNLRRSLLAPTSVALLWWSFTFEGVKPLAALALVFGAHAAGPTLGALACMLPRQPGASWRHLLRGASLALARALGTAAWRVGALMHDACVRVDAIARAAWRMAASHRRLLQWTPAAQAEAALDRSLAATLKRQRPVIAAAFAWTLLGLPVSGAYRGWLVVVGLAWMLWPLAIWGAGQPLRRLRRSRELPQADRDLLHDLARDHWRLFELTVGPSHHHLPPDHLQLEPRPVVAHRTSPTHIGLYLGACVCAHRFGFLGTEDLVRRLASTLDTLERLPRHRGHLLHWVDTETLQTLAPPHVSTADSGNLAGQLWAVAQACRELADGPAPHEAWQRSLRRAQQRVRHASASDMQRTMPEATLQSLLHDDLWSAWRREPARLRSLVAAAGPRWLDRTPAQAIAQPALQPLADLLRQLDSLLRDREAERDAWPPALRSLARRADAIVEAMDFGFLYDPRRRLLRAGHRPDHGVPDAGHHELLASEARMASYVAVAKGDVPLRHWAALGRIWGDAQGRPALLSWTGSMFEYLMPSLLMAEPAGSVLRRAGETAVRAQRAWGGSRNLPWGASESAYFAQDASLGFLYGPFGVPRLALRRTPRDEDVVAPYATVLAAMVDTPAALANLKRLERAGARGLCGFIDAVDHSAARRGEEGQPQPVPTFLSHHHGMSLQALANVLHADVVRGWFARAPLARSHALLLHERVPQELVLRPQDEHEAPPHEAAVARPRAIDPHAEPLGALPTQVLGNGRYGVWLRPQGAGSSIWRGRAVHRTRDDLLRDAHGHWLMLRRGGEVEFHSLTRAPNPRPDAHYRTRFHGDRVEFDADCDDWEARTTVWVGAEHDIEFRRVVLHNLDASPDGAPTEFELLSWFEASLCEAHEDAEHPSLCRLLVRAHAADPHGVLLERRARTPDESPMWVAHFLATCSLEPAAVRITCDRARLLPRLGHVSQARPGTAPAGSLDGQFDTGLDPVASLAVRLQVPASSRVELCFATAAAEDPESLFTLIDQYRQEVHVQRSRRLATMVTRLRRRELGLDESELQAIQDLATLVAGTPSRQRPAPEGLLDRRTLRRRGVPTDKPLLLVRADTSAALPVLRALVAAQRLWQEAGVACELVVLDGEAAAVPSAIEEGVQGLVGALGPAGPRAGWVRVLRWRELGPAELGALQAHARVELLADGRPLKRLVAQALSAHRPASRAAAAAALGDESAPTPDRRQRAAIAEAPWGHEPVACGFAEGGRAFEVVIDSQRVTPRPWSNVLANEGFGCVVTEAGGGHTWARDSRLHAITPASHDPLLDTPSEHFLLQDVATRETFGLMPTPDRNGLQGYRVTHTQGASRFAQERQGLLAELSVGVHPAQPAKLLSLTLRNTGAQPRTLRLVAMVEWQLGARREDRATLATEFVPQLQALLARQLEHEGGFGDATAWLSLVGARATQWTCAREEFFDALGRLRLPRAFGGASGLGLDPCAALEAVVTLAPGETLECGWVLGHGHDRAAALALAQSLHTPLALRAATLATEKAWRERLAALHVSTPDEGFDALLNHWLPYQALAGGLWARAGFYRDDGALQFREALQDAQAFAITEPQRLREQLLLQASRQFGEGDVQHSWHPALGAGLRTRRSDDALWLAQAAQYYLEVTGDAQLLDEVVPFLEGDAVPEGASQLYAIAREGRPRASFYEHVARALDRGLRFGPHGLPLIEGGDGLEGLDAVGREGRGESVWGGWLLLSLLRAWLPRALQRHDEARAARWREALASLEPALRQHGWDGRWYRRAYFDNGHPLGSHLNAEGRIDLATQAWSVFASAPGDERAREAMEAADGRLVDRRVGVVRLLAPPLRLQADDAGAVQALPPGVRENGGQVCEAGAWAVAAQAQLGHAERAWEYFCLLSPVHRASNSLAQRRYRLEPYAVAGDVCTQAPWEGRGGWSWTPGAAGALYRVAVESLLGLVWRAQRLCFAPCLPPHWPQARVTLQLRGKRLDVLLRVAAPFVAEEAPDGARRVVSGEWIEWDSLPAECELVVDVSPPQPPRAEAGAPEVVAV